MTVIMGESLNYLLEWLALKQEFHQEPKKDRYYKWVTESFSQMMYLKTVNHLGTYNITVIISESLNGLLKWVV